MIGLIVLGMVQAFAADRPQDIQVPQAIVEGEVPPPPPPPPVESKPKESKTKDS